jgi:copper chaperone CopZ
MKRLSVLLVMVSMVAGVGIGFAGAGGGTVSTSFAVEGMHCDGCSATIKGTLERIEGVLSAEADHEAGTAVVVHEKKVSADELKLAIEKLGYTVTSTETADVDK